MFTQNPNAGSSGHTHSGTLKQAGGGVYRFATLSRHGNITEHVAHTHHLNLSTGGARMAGLQDKSFLTQRLNSSYIVSNLASS